MKETELVVALDYSDQRKAEALMAELSDLPVIYKIGLELFLSSHSDWVPSLCAKGVRIFLDLKFHDIPNTVAAAVIRAASLGVEFTTLHLSGGRKMLDEVQVRLENTVSSGQLKTPIKVLGVSVLTSFAEEDWITNVSHMAKVTGVRTLSDTVMHFARFADLHPAVHGMVCSPHEIEMIRAKYPSLYLMVPGIRLEGGESHDQARVMTPREACRLGASAIVVGRPITQSKEPREVVLQILRDLK